jgi:hypothetical protein
MSRDFGSMPHAELLQTNGSARESPVPRGKFCKRSPGYLIVVDWQERTLLKKDHSSALKLILILVHLAWCAITRGQALISFRASDINNVGAINECLSESTNAQANLIYRFDCFN